MMSDKQYPACCESASLHPYRGLALYPDVFNQAAPLDHTMQPCLFYRLENSDNDV